MRTLSLSRPRRQEPPQGARLRVVVLASLLLTEMLAHPLPAAAHARLVSATPPSGSALGVPPATIQLAFSEPIDPSFVSASLFAGDETPIGAGPPSIGAGARSVEVPVSPSLQPGSYLLVWRVLSAVDGHTTTGTVAFSTGTGVAPVTGTAGPAPRPPWWRAAVRWTELLSLLLVAGGFLTSLLLGPKTAAGTRQASIRAAQMLLAGSLGALALGLLLAAYDLGLSATGASLDDPPSFATYRALLLDSFRGRALLLRALLFIATLVVVRFLVADRAFFPKWSRLGLGLAAAMLLTHSAAGHARTVANDRLAIAVDWAHLLAIAVWFGSLPYLWLRLRVNVTVDGTGNRGTAAVDRFSRVALGAMAVIVVSGLLRASAHVAGGRSLQDEDYGRVLIAKHLLFLPIMIAAAVNRFVTLPRLRAAVSAPAGDGMRHPSRTLARGVAVELTLGAFVVAAAAALTELPPADAPLPVAVAARPLAIEQSSPLGDLDLRVSALLTGDLDDQFAIEIADATGQPPAAIQRVIVESRTTTSDGMAAGDRFDATPARDVPGAFDFPALRLGLSAVWDLRIVVRRAGLADAEATLTVDLSESGLAPPRLVEDEWRMPRLTLPAWGLGILAFACLLGGVGLVARLRRLEPFAAAIVLTMTALITGGFAVQAARMTVPTTAGTALVNPVPADSASLQRGEALSRAACLACHGPAGAGVEDDPEHGHGSSADLTDRRTRLQRDGDLFHTIGAGVPGTEMPAFDEALTAEERWDLVNYLRDLQRRRSDRGVGE